MVAMTVVMLVPNGLNANSTISDMLTPERWQPQPQCSGLECLDSSNLITSPGQPITVSTYSLNPAAPILQRSPVPCGTLATASVVQDEISTPTPINVLDNPTDMNPTDGDAIAVDPVIDHPLVDCAPCQPCQSFQPAYYPTYTTTYTPITHQSVHYQPMVYLSLIHI